MKTAWYLDLESGEIKKHPVERFAGANWGDYKHHDMDGPYRTFSSALKEAVIRYEFDRLGAAKTWRSATSE